MRPTNGPSRGYYLDNVSFETAWNDALVGTVARSGGSARISKACNKDRPLQTIKARLPFLYLEYLSSDPSEKTEYPFLIGYVYEPFPRANRIISLDPYVAIHSNKGLLPLLCPTSTHVSHEYFLSCWNRIGTCSGGISLFDLSASESPFGRRCVTWNKFGVNILEGSLMGSKGKL